MIDMNETKLTGNLVANIETTTAGETTVTRGRLIRTNSHRDRESGEWKQSAPMGFDFEVWGNHGKALAEKAGKGTAILIEGAWIPNHFEKEDGTKVFGIRLRVTRWQIVAQPGSRTATPKRRTRKKTTAAKA
jgi:single-stranded DNA-binding protein